MSGLIASAILCRAFNVAILHITGRILPRGYDVGPDAPETFPALRDHFARTGRVLVWDGASDSTIYGCPEVNFAFRAWHDSAHLRGGYDFTPEGEAAAAEMQVSDMRALYSGETAERFARIIRAEVSGQAEHFARFGAFPRDQFAFVRAYMESPARAMESAF